MAASSGREEIDLVVLPLLRLLRFGRHCVGGDNFGVLAIFIGIHRDSPWYSTSCYGLGPYAKTMLDLHATGKARKLQNLSPKQRKKSRQRAETHIRGADVRL